MIGSLDRGTMPTMMQQELNTKQQNQVQPHKRGQSTAVAPGHRNGPVGSIQ